MTNGSPFGGWCSHEWSIGQQQTPRAAGVATVLVKSHGQPWPPNVLTSIFADSRAALALPAKHFHDFRGKCCTELCKAQFTNREAAHLMGLTEAQVDTTRTLYVDEAAVVVAIGQRLTGTQPVKRSVTQ